MPCVGNDSVLSLALINKRIIIISQKLELIKHEERIFLQKESLSAEGALLAETASFGSFGISAEMNFFEEPSFGFR